MYDETDQEPCYSPRLDRALAHVAETFRYQVRKGSDIPYLTHLLQVMVTVGEHGGTEEQMIAGLLHDSLEDIEGASVEQVEARFGAPVAEMVLALSDSTSPVSKAPWKERKQAYLDRLAGEPAAIKLVCAADKLHNARSIVRDLGLVGDAVWDRFSATCEETLWYYRTLVTALRTGWSHPLLDEVERAVDELHVVAAEAPVTDRPAPD